MKQQTEWVFREWIVDRNSFFMGGAIFGFAILLIGFILPFPNQISFILSIIFSSCVIMLWLIFINIIELIEGRENGLR